MKVFTFLPRFNAFSHQHLRFCTFIHSAFLYIFFVYYRLYYIHTLFCVLGSSTDLLYYTLSLHDGGSLLWISHYMFNEANYRYPGSAQCSFNLLSVHTDNALEEKKIYLLFHVFVLHKPLSASTFTFPLYFSFIQSGTLLSRLWCEKAADSSRPYSYQTRGR